MGLPHAVPVALKVVLGQRSPMNINPADLTGLSALSWRLLSAEGHVK
jgi:hypothetical protein